MPILNNFHILLATIYMIYWTNILIQCPMPVPVCCLFFVSQDIHIKRSPNTIKLYRDFFGIYVNFCKKYQRKTMLKGPTTHQVTPGDARRALMGCWHLIRRGLPSSAARKIIYGLKSPQNFSPIRFMDLREFKKR